MAKNIFIMVLILGFCSSFTSSAEAQTASIARDACGNALIYRFQYDAVYYCDKITELYQVRAIAKALKKQNRGCASASVMVVMAAGIKSLEEALAVSRAVESGQCLEDAVKEIHRSKTSNGKRVEEIEPSTATS